MAYFILGVHGNYGPRGKRSYYKRTSRSFKTKDSAKKWAKDHTISGTRSVYAATSSVAPCTTASAKREKLVYIK